MSWTAPSVEQLRIILEQSNVPAPEVERAVELYSAPKLIRWGALDREFARRALAGCTRGRRR